MKRHELRELEGKIPATLYNYVQLQLSVNDDVLAERQRQNAIYGVQRHDYGKWLAIIGEEFGESCEALGALMGLITGKPTDAQDAYEELIHLAATASAAAEQIREYRGL